jgi:predicted SnoaL-like aldol condensation-catalyzing enzyme
MLHFRRNTAPERDAMTISKAFLHLIAPTIVGLVLLGGSASASPKSTACANTADANRKAVIAFYDLALVNLKPRAGFERYASTDFIEHKPDVPDGTRAATITFLEGLIVSMPKPKWEILRTIAEGDMVFLHARFTPAEGAPPYAVADVFRLKNCKIVEHWDVVAGPPAEQRNPHTRF